MSFHVPEQYRYHGHRAPPSSKADGNNGAFTLYFTMKQGTPHREFFVIASDGLGWEHVSVSLDDRCPTWEEMCAVKNLFWDEDDCVVQYHPPKSDYVNAHPFCLHLWRPIDTALPRPPSDLVGPKGKI